MKRMPRRGFIRTAAMGGSSLLLPTYSWARVLGANSDLRLGVIGFRGRGRKHTDLHADILEGHLSSALCHTGNISWQLGAKRQPEAVREAIKGDKGADEAFGRMAEHLAANGVDIIKDRVTLGAFLKMDPKTERFIGDEIADEMLTRPYRPGFVVPQKA